MLLFIANLQDLLITVVLTGVADFKHRRKGAAWSESVQRIETDVIRENMVSEEIDRTGLF